MVRQRAHVKGKGFTPIVITITRAYTRPLRVGRRLFDAHRFSAHHVFALLSVFVLGCSPLSFFHPMSGVCLVHSPRFVRKGSR